MLKQTYQELNEIHVLSNTILSLAESDDWDSIPDIEQQRDKLIRHFFENKDFDAGDRGIIEQTIQSVLQINNRFTVLAEQKKLTINAQMQDLRKRQNVNSAYLQNK